MRSACEIASLCDDEEFIAHRRAADGVCACVEGAERASVGTTIAVLRDELHDLAFG